MVPSINDLIQTGALEFVKKRGGLTKLLQDVYHNHDWKAEKFSSKQKRSSQWCLYKTLQLIFPPGTEIIEEFHLPSMLFAQSEYLMTFDVYIPALNLAFEYHGYQHYYDHHLFGSAKTNEQKDKQKREACMHHIITYL